MPAASLSHLHRVNQNESAALRSLVRSGSCPHVSAAHLGSGPSVKPLSFAKERSVAAGRAIGFGQGGAAKRERLAEVLDMAPGRISRAFSARYPDTLNDERIAKLAEEWPAVRELMGRAA